MINGLYFLEIVQDYNIVTPKIETQKSSLCFRRASLSNSVDATDRICYNGGGLGYINYDILISAIDIKEVKLWFAYIICFFFLLSQSFLQ